MKLIKVILIILVNLSAYSFTLSSSVYDIRVNDSKYKVSPLNHYGNDLVSTIQVSKYLLPKTNYNSSERRFEGSDFILTFTPGTIFIVKENWLGKSIAQLDLPVLSMKKSFYFPLKSLIYSLDSLNIYKVLAGDDGKHFLLSDNSFSGLANLPTFEALKELKKEAEQTLKLKSSDLGKAILFSSGDGKSIKVSESNPFKESFLNLNKKLSSSLDNLKPEEFIPSKQVLEETKIDSLQNQNNEYHYLIPKGLIRKELEEIRKKTPN